MSPSLYFRFFVISFYTSILSLLFYFVITKNAILIKHDFHLCIFKINLYYTYSVWFCFAAVCLLQCPGESNQHRAFSPYSFVPDLHQLSDPFKSCVGVSFPCACVCVCPVCRVERVVSRHRGLPVSVTGRRTPRAEMYRKLVSQSYQTRCRGTLYSLSRPGSARHSARFSLGLGPTSLLDARLVSANFLAAVSPAESHGAGRPAGASAGARGAFHFSTFPATRSPDARAALRVRR